jgi:hypothetical protein
VSQVLLDIFGKLGRVILNPRIILNKIRQNRVLRKDAARASGTHSSRRINYLLSKLPYEDRKYLEIGVAHGYTFEAVSAPTKTGVDPFLKCRIRRDPSIKLIETKSKDYFDTTSQTNEKFDVIFVDGSHTFQEAYRDIIQALNMLTVNGFLLVDDTVPEDEFSALPDHSLCNSKRKSLGLNRETWSGDVYIAIIAISKFHPEVGIHTIIGPQHPQSILWRKHPLVNETPITQVEITTVKSISYDEVFSSFEYANSIFNFSLERNVFKKLGILSE